MGLHVGDWILRAGLAISLVGGAAGAPPRDWTKYPPIVERTTRADIVGLGDVHGGYDRLVALLSAAHLIQPAGQGYSWAGGRTVLVSVGDLIDKGDKSLPVMDLMIALTDQARSAGGEVVVTLGNHEAEFLADPSNKKARREIDKELKDKGLDPRAVASGQGPYGAWMRTRPLAARINSWFFAHAGNTSGAATAELARQFVRAVDRGDWGSPFLIGDNSILEAQKWWKGTSLDADLAGVEARHVVFGHDPGAFDPPGHIRQHASGKLFCIDVGMSPAVDLSSGELLVIHRAGATDEASALDSSGRRTAIWRGPS